MTFLVFHRAGYSEQVGDGCWPRGTKECAEFEFHKALCLNVGWDSSVGITTGYELDGPRIESRWMRTFRIRPDRPWGPPSLLYSGYWVSFPGVKRPGRGVNHSSPSGAEVKE
jgi:hypothetical protein